MGVRWRQGRRDVVYTMVGKVESSFNNYLHNLPHNHFFIAVADRFRNQMIKYFCLGYLAQLNNHGYPLDLLMFVQLLATTFVEHLRQVVDKLEKYLQSSLRNFPKGKATWLNILTYSVHVMFLSLSGKVLNTSFQRSPIPVARLLHILIRSIEKLSSKPKSYSLVIQH